MTVRRWQVRTTGFSTPRAMAAMDSSSDMRLALMSGGRRRSRWVRPGEVNGLMGPGARVAAAGIRNVRTGLGANRAPPTIMNTRNRAVKMPGVMRSRAQPPPAVDPPRLECIRVRSRGSPMRGGAPP